ncbi:ABC transporter substrate-binding protein [Pigmentiphaga litoralis]|uniref:ABC transporter substrate-binding protein n=1 Tax=Pigmentiphaga litoralis TaxID=516702 RepID=UPI003B42CDF9
MRRTFLRRTGALAAAAALTSMNALTLALMPTTAAHAQAAPAAPAKPTALRPFTLAGWSKPITEITHLLVEEEKGFFRSEGLALNYLPGAGGGDALRNLLSRQADIAFTDPGSFFAALDKGEKLRAVYDIYPQNVFNVVSLPASNIRKPGDLKGKRVGVYSLSSGTLQNLQILLQQAGLKKDDVTVVVTGLLNFAPLIQGQVDATAATDTGLALARRRGVRDPQVIEVGDYLNYSSDILVVRESTYQQNKDMLRRFLAGFRRSAQWMIDQPAEAAQLAVKRAIDGQDPALNREIIDIRNRSAVSTLTKERGLGTLDEKSLQAAADAYRKLGLIERDIRIRDVIGTDLLSPR